MTVQEILSRLERVSKAHSGWMARCPAHEDARPSLSVGAAEDGRVLLRCFAGCDLAAILGALRIEVRDLFPDQSSMASASRSTCRPPCNWPRPGRLTWPWPGVGWKRRGRQ